MRLWRRGGVYEEQERGKVYDRAYCLTKNILFMGKIRIGRGGGEVYEQTPFGASVKKGKASAPSLDAADKASVISDIMAGPKETHVQALRDAGLTEEADALERGYAEEHLEEMAAESRRRRLREIEAFPEGERLPLLTAEGFTEEAKALEVKMAKEKAEAESRSASVAEDAPLEDAPAVAKETPVPEKPKTAKAKAPAKAKPFKFDDRKKNSKK